VSFQKTTAAIFAVLSINCAAFAACTSDQALAEAGWVIHGTHEFQRIQSQLQVDLNKNAADFVNDMSSNMMSEASQRPIQVNSYDRLSTPQEIMYGDILMIVDLDSGRNSELRWFDGQSKHVVYNSEFQSCATNFIPMASNALF
jgi:hypothetical protein